jgi:hypothetical protein
MRAILLAATLSLSASAQMPPTQDFAPPPLFTPDAATLAAIKAKTAELQILVNTINTSPAYIKNKAEDVMVYLKAAEWIVRHNEWYAKDSGKQTLSVLDAGLARGKSALKGEAPWRESRGQPIIRGYTCNIDDTAQPFSITFPKDIGKDGKKYLVEVNLHGRDATLTEVKFIASREAAKESNPDRIIVDVYGRGNNGYRWAGENDVWNVLTRCKVNNHPLFNAHIDDRKPILRGFSMGGGGTWAYGLHHPFTCSALQPGAGFTLTRGHAGKFPEQLPDYQERTLRIYDVANCAENLANVPCVAYSGDKDPQIRAARNIEAALKDFKLPVKFEHVIAPGLEHKMPPEWKAKVDAKLAGLLPQEVTQPTRVHYVTYTTAYPDFRLGTILGLEQHYERAVVDVENNATTITATTSNISRITLATGLVTPNEKMSTKNVILDGQALPGVMNYYQKVGGKWEAYNPTPFPPVKTALRKSPRCQGPIDEAFTRRFSIQSGIAAPWHPAIQDGTDAVRKEFIRVWDKYFRGDLTKLQNNEFGDGTQVYFGDPGSNPAIAAALPELPIKWTRETLSVNGVDYDARTHYPVLIYPRRGIGAIQYQFDGYHVLNTGHTFGEDAFKGSNVMLYPRLGDWAVMKLAPTKANPHATEVVAAGIFDENWQFEKK